MALAFLWRWLRRTALQRRDLNFLLYTRADCPLCDKAWDLLLRYQKDYGFVIETRNVDESPDLVRQFGDCVPVVAINGKIRFRGQINEVLLQRILTIRA